MQVLPGFALHDWQRLCACHMRCTAFIDSPINASFRVQDLLHCRTSSLDRLTVIFRSLLARCGVIGRFCVFVRVRCSYDGSPTYLEYYITNCITSDLDLFLLALLYNLIFLTNRLRVHRLYRLRVHRHGCPLSPSRTVTLMVTRRILSGCALTYAERVNCSLHFDGTKCSRLR